MAIFDTPNKLEALAGIPWSPQGAPSWHPTATGIEEHAERIASLRDPDSTGTEHGHTTLSSLDSISGLDWNLDWSVLGNFPGSSEYNNMNSLDPFAALDAMDGNIDDTILAQLSGLDANPSGEMSLAPEISSVREPTAFPPWNEPNSSFVEPWPVPRERYGELRSPECCGYLTTRDNSVVPVTGCTRVAILDGTASSFCVS